MEKSKIFYLDDNNNIVDKDKATRSIIQEFDENGNMVREIFGRNKNVPIEKVKMRSYDEFTEEEKDFLAGFVDKDGNHPFARK